MLFVLSDLMEVTIVASLFGMTYLASKDERTWFWHWATVLARGQDSMNSKPDFAAGWLDNQVHLAETYQGNVCPSANGHSCTFLPFLGDFSKLIYSRQMVYMKPGNHLSTLALIY